LFAFPGGIAASTDINFIELFFSSFPLPATESLLPLWTIR
jgi:hypothetical protein